MSCWFTCTSTLIGDTRIEEEPQELVMAEQLRRQIDDATNYARSLANHCLGLWDESMNIMIQSLDKMLADIQGEHDQTQKNAAYFRSPERTYSETKVQNLYKETTDKFLRRVLPCFDYFKMDEEISKVEGQITTCNKKMAEVRAKRQELYTKYSDDQLPELRNAIEDVQATTAAVQLATVETLTLTANSGRGVTTERSVHIGILHVKAVKALEECETKCIKADSCHRNAADAKSISGNLIADFKNNCKSCLSECQT
eukprot:GHVU01224981.1.p1 GENE.GHVU01224981.1~~GHVU01224981.1.p1  ORF type:complete len:256 (+),score=23.81 GHVU01224981.1:555-1322(+)